jgi:alpha-tubulin suppressor-like RCC1 family protein
MKKIYKSAIVAMLLPGDSKSEDNPYVYAWGNNISGQLGIGSDISKAYPNLIEDLRREKIQGIFSSGQSNSNAALTASGGILTWGNGLDGILAQNSGDSNKLVPTKVPLDYKLTKVAIGGGHMAALTLDGQVVSWGLDDCGQCGHEIVSQVVDPRNFRPQVLRGKSPNLVKNFPDSIKIVDISCGRFFTAAVTEDGNLFTWGSGRDYNLGHGDRNPQKLPKQVKGLEGIKIIKVACGRDFAVALDANGNLYSWGNNDYGQLGLGQTEKFKATPQVIREINNVVEVACGDFHVLALNKDGEVYSWGNGFDGQLCHGSTSNHSSPSLINNIPPIARISCGGGHSGFITQNFELLMAGRGTDGQLGRQGKIESLASNRTVAVPVDHFKGKKVLQIAAGAHHTLALVIDK